MRYLSWLQLSVNLDIDLTCSSLGTINTRIDYPGYGDVNILRESIHRRFTSHFITKTVSLQVGKLRVAYRSNILLLYIPILGLNRG